MLSTLRSFREHRINRIVQHGASVASIEGDVLGISGARQLTWTHCAEKGRLLELDGSPTSNLKEWFSPIRAILFCPENVSIVRGGPEERRGFVDRARFTATPAYLDLVRSYRRALRQKSVLLHAPRSPQAAELDVWDSRLAELGVRMAQQRLEIIDQLRDPFQQMMSFIAGNEHVDLQVIGVGIPGVTARSLREKMLQARPLELRRRMVLSGPHRDDVRISINGHPARQFASQGQARSIVLALKLAELEAARRRGDAPLFLLDDLTSELDARRRAHLVEILASMESQVWITTTDPGYLSTLPKDQSCHWRVSAGQVRSGDN